MKVAVIEGGQFLITPQVTVARPALTSRTKKSRKQVLRQLAQVVAELRREAHEKGIDMMSKREINAAVSAARRDLKRSSNRAMK